MEQKRKQVSLRCGRDRELEPRPRVDLDQEELAARRVSQHLDLGDPDVVEGRRHALRQVFDLRLVRCFHERPDSA